MRMRVWSCQEREYIVAACVGVWRSLVAHTLGVRVVAGSNPATPTNLKSSKSKGFSEFRLGMAQPAPEDCAQFCALPFSPSKGRLVSVLRSSVAIASRRA